MASIYLQIIKKKMYSNEHSNSFRTNRRTYLISEGKVRSPVKLTKQIEINNKIYSKPTVSKTIQVQQISAQVRLNFEHKYNSNSPPAKVMSNVLMKLRLKQERFTLAVS